MKKKTFLITGGTGFIGSAIIKRLVKENKYNIICTDSNIRGNLRKIKDVKNNIKFIKADIRDKKTLIKISKKVDSIIHLAFLNGTEYFYSKPELVLDIGVKGIINVIDACKKNKIKELILASSSEVYHHPKKTPTNEKAELKIPDPFNPRYSYSAGKMISEIIAINNSKIFKKLLIFRPHNVYGPDMGFEHVIPEFILRIKNSIKKSKFKKINFTIRGNGSETRAFNFIDDFVDAFMIMLKKGKHNNIYHIGSNEEIKIKELANIISKNFKVSLNIVNKAGVIGGTKKRCPDISKLKSLGYKPKTKIHKGLIPTLNWYIKNSHLKSKI